MNAQRRKDLEKARGMIEEVKSILETAQSEEQDYYDNMAENLQGGEKGEKASAAADKLQEMVEACDEIVSGIDEASE